ncbi:hypothetical protein Bca4012_058325 [Brassica carinata]
MTVPSYSDEKRARRYVDMLHFIANSDYGIPEYCPCGSQIIIKISKAEADVGKKFFVCKDFENDGLHRKKELNGAIEEETRRLRTKVDDNERRIRSLGPLEYKSLRTKVDDNERRIRSLGPLEYKIDEINKTKKNADEVAQLKEIIKNLYPNVSA